jgi:Uma2 family endonuclease
VKRALYARNGVHEYWIVDDGARSVEVLSLRQGQYEPAGYFQSSDVVESPLLTGLSVRVQDVFA